MSSFIVMKSKFLISFLIILELILSPSAASAYVQVLGEKDSAGQATTEVDVNVGTVEEIGKNKLEIRGKGKKIEILTDKNTRVIEKPSGKRIDFEKIKKEDRIATFATPSAQASKSAHIVLVKPKREGTEGAKPETRRRAIYGLVREINGNILVISHPLKDKARYKVGVVDGTVIKIKDIVSPTIADIHVGDRVAAVGEIVGDVLFVKRVHVIPGKAIGLLERVATRSATTSPSPTAIPSVTPVTSPVPTP